MERRFYRPSRSGLAQATARLAETVVSRGKSIAIHSKTPERAAEIDDALWQFAEFLPHSRDNHDPISQVQIGKNAQGDVDFVMDDTGVEASPNGDNALICYLFHASDVDIVAQRRADWAKWRDKGDHLTYWAENEDGNWLKAAEENAPKQ